MSLEADLAEVQRSLVRGRKAESDLAQLIANKVFGLNLPLADRYVEDGVVYEVNVWASIRKVGREDGD